MHSDSEAISMHELAGDCARKGCMHGRYSKHTQMNQHSMITCQVFVICDENKLVKSASPHNPMR
jgi:hypothetical protein